MERKISKFKAFTTEDNMNKIMKKATSAVLSGIMIAGLSTGFATDAFAATITPSILVSTKTMDGTDVKAIDTVTTDYIGDAIVIPAALVAAGDVAIMSDNTEPIKVVLTNSVGTVDSWTAGGGFSADDLIISSGKETATLIIPPNFEGDVPVTCTPVLASGDISGGFAVTLKVFNDFGVSATLGGTGANAGALIPIKGKNPKLSGTMYSDSDDSITVNFEANTALAPKVLAGTATGDFATGATSPVTVGPISSFTVPKNSAGSFTVEYNTGAAKTSYVFTVLSKTPAVGVGSIKAAYDSKNVVNNTIKSTAQDTVDFTPVFATATAPVTWSVAGGTGSFSTATPITVDKAIASIPVEIGDRGTITIAAKTATQDVPTKYTLTVTSAGIEKITAVTTDAEITQGFNGDEITSNTGTGVIKVYLRPTFIDGIKKSVVWTAPTAGNGVTGNILLPAANTAATLTKQVGFQGNVGTATNGYQAILTIGPDAAGTYKVGANVGGADVFYTINIVNSKAVVKSVTARTTAGVGMYSTSAIASDLAVNNFASPVTGTVVFTPKFSGSTVDSSVSWAVSGNPVGGVTGATITKGNAAFDEESGAVTVPFTAAATGQEIIATATLNGSTVTYTVTVKEAFALTGSNVTYVTGSNFAEFNVNNAGPEQIVQFYTNATTTGAKIGAPITIKKGQNNFILSPVSAFTSINYRRVMGTEFFPPLTTTATTSAVTPVALMPVAGSAISSVKFAGPNVVGSKATITAPINVQRGLRIGDVVKISLKQGNKNPVSFCADKTVGTDGTLVITDGKFTTNPTSADKLILTVSTKGKAFPATPAYEIAFPGATITPIKTPSPLATNIVVTNAAGLANDKVKISGFPNDSVIRLYTSVAYAEAGTAATQTVANNTGLGIGTAATASTKEVGIFVIPSTGSTTKEYLFNKSNGDNKTTLANASSNTSDLLSGATNGTLYATVYNPIYGASSDYTIIRFAQATTSLKTPTLTTDGKTISIALKETVMPTSIDATVYYKKTGTLNEISKSVKGIPVSSSTKKATITLADDLLAMASTPGVYEVSLTASSSTASVSAKTPTILVTVAATDSDALKAPVPAGIIGENDNAGVLFTNNIGPVDKVDVGVLPVGYTVILLDRTSYPNLANVPTMLKDGTMVVNGVATTKATGIIQTKPTVKDKQTQFSMNLAPFVGSGGTDGVWAVVVDNDPLTTADRKTQRVLGVGTGSPFQIADESATPFALESGKYDISLTTIKGNASYMMIVNGLRVGDTVFLTNSKTAKVKSMKATDTFVMFSNLKDIDGIDEIAVQRLGTVKSADLPISGLKGYSSTAKTQTIEIMK